MPQPIKKWRKMAYRGYPRHLLDRPELAALVGTIAVEWAYLDRTLIDIFERACSSAIARDPIASVVLDALSSLTLRLDLIDKVLRMRGAKALADDFELLKPTIRKAAKDRAKVVHGFWNLTDDYPSDLILLDMSGRAWRYTKKDFDEILDRLVVARNDVHDFAIVVANTPMGEPQFP